MTRFQDRLFTPIAKVVSTTLATFSMLSCAMAQELTVQWAADPADPKSAYVEVTGLSQELLQQLSAANTSLDQWQKQLSVHAESSITDAPPMLGSYRAQQGVIRFQPQFPLERGMLYRARFRPPSGSEIVSTFQVPALASTPPTIIRSVYPTANVVPENLLKFYLEFSAPMSRGDVYDFIRLLDADGKAIDLPFLQLGEELWNPEMTRLTLLFDPGRIKRGVQPLEEIGPALVEGKRFSLVIDQAWKDANGQPLKAPFRKEFIVGPPDRTPIDPTKWNITTPQVGTQNALQLDFGESLDFALAQRLIRVTDATGSQIPGRTILQDDQRRWSFIPESLWLASRYAITIQTTLEDLAGNNIGKPFDVDVFRDIQDQVPGDSVTLSVEIR